MTDQSRFDWRRFPGSGLSRSAIAAAATRRAELLQAVRVLAAVAVTFADLPMRRVDRRDVAGAVLGVVTAAAAGATVGS